MKARIINGEIEYFQQPAWILGDASDFANKHGFKDVIYQWGDNGIYETETHIVIENPISETLSNSEKRKQAYQNDAVIEWSGEIITCFDAKDKMLMYQLSGQNEKFEALQVLWINARSEIQNKYPD